MLQQADEGVPLMQVVDRQLGRHRVGQGAAVVECGEDAPGEKRKEEGDHLPRPEGNARGAEGEIKTVQRKRGNQQECIGAGEQRQCCRERGQHKAVAEVGPHREGEQENHHAGFQTADGEGDAVGCHRPDQRGDDPRAF